MKKYIKPLFIPFIISIIISFIFCLFYSAKTVIEFNFLYTLTNEIKNINFWIRFLLIFTLAFFIQLHFIFDINKLYNLLYKNRYYIATAIILFAVSFELNNSSIDLWNIINDDNAQISDVIFGKARFIRLDEFNVYTPIALSQHPKYPYFSEILRGTKTDCAIIDPQPIKNIITLFRPFLLGFLFLGSAKGLSFFWIVRLVLLFIVIFELLLLITDKNKILSLFGTFLIAFSPGIHWWFTISGLVEMIIYCSSMVLLLNRYMLAKNFTEKFLLLLIIYICFGSFALILYPAWQVPCAYIFASLAVWVFIKNYNNFNFTKKDLILIIFFTVLLSLVFYYIYDKSKETIDIVRNTVYPGKRNALGGSSLTEIDIGCGFLTQIFRYWGNIFLTIFDDTLVWNQCLYSAFIDLFPMGLILSVIIFFKDKNKDKLLILMSAVFIFLSLWLFVGFPQFLADLTLLKTSPAYRTIILWGFLNVLILIRALNIIKFKFNNLTAIIISLILAIVSVTANRFIYQDFMDFIKLSIIFILSSFMFYYILKNRINKFFVTLTAIIMIISGLAANPIQRGLDVIYEAPLAKAIKQINDADPGLWIFDTGTLTSVFIMNYPIMQGAATFNSTNIYPNLEAFKKLDKEDKYSLIYNRSCHVAVNLIEDAGKYENFKKFVIVGQEYIAINMPIDDLIQLNIKYVLSLRNLSDFSNEKIKFEPLYSTEKCVIHKLYYQTTD